MKNFLRRLVGFSLGPVLGAVISLIQVPILTAFISANEYGKAGLYQNMILLIPSFIYIGIDQAYTREYHSTNNRKHLVQHAMLIPLIVSTGLSGLMIIFSGVASNYLFGSSEYQYIIWFSALWLFATVIERFVLLTIRMEEQAVAYSAWSFFIKLGTFILSMFLIFLGWRDFRVIVFGLLFGQLVIDLVLFLRYRELFDLRYFKLNKSLLKRMFQFGLPLMIALSLSSALNAVDQVFIRQFAQFSDNGVYSVGIRIAGVVGIVKTAFSSFWVPTAYRWYEEKKSMVHYEFISNSLLFILTILFIGILMMKQPVAWIVSITDSRYADVQYILGLMILPHIMYTLSETTTLGIVFSRKTHYNIYVSLLTIIPNIILNVLLTPIWGARGAALASALAYVLFYFARTYFSSQTGFYFSQKRQILIIALMIFVAVINAFQIPNIELWTLLLGLIMILLQWNTIKTASEIRKNPTAWDFN